ncbi:MAG: hypothetical protein Q9M50_05400 [Methylococcales bacterium]|nr:hypothetical protein [Methylococcales bacterium]
MFAHSLPLFFMHLNMGSFLELSIIFATLGGVLYISAPLVNGLVEDKPFSSPLYYCLYAWTAKLALWRVFWPFFIALNIGLYTADYAMSIGEFTVSSWDDVHFMLFVFGCFWTVVVWRNSINCLSQIWMASARLMTLTLFFEFGVKIVMRIYYPRILFDCSHRVLDYMVCF